MTLRAGIALAAVAVTLATPQAVMAKATANPGTAEQLRIAMEQIKQLQQQVATLQARMDQQGNAAEQAAADAQAASTKAEQALAQANAANTTAVAANTTAEKAGKGLDATKWAADTKISGRMYYNISAVDANGASPEKDGGFQIKRFYVGVDHKFDDTFSGNVTMDIDNVANTSGSNVGKGFYLKKAYLQAKIDPALTVRLGSADLPWVPYAEGLYGYRHIEKTLTDLDSFGTSSDWGVHAMGDLADGLISYQLSAIDGGGYRDPKFTKTIDLEGRLSLKYKGFNAAVGGYTGKLGNDVEGAAAYRTARRFNALLAYQGKVGDMPITVGGEYFHAKNWKVKAVDPKDTAEGYSLFASVSPMPKWSLFGRYDWVKPKQDTNPAQKDQYFNVGIQFSPAKIVDFALVYKRDNADGGLKIGNLGTGQETRDEFGLYGQFRF